MISSKQVLQADVWEKWEWLWQAIFYGAVLVAVFFLVRDENLETPLWFVSALTLLFLVWHLVGFRWAYRGPGHDLNVWHARALARFIIILGDITLWFVLVNISPAFYLVLFGLFIQVFRHLPVGYAAIASVLLTVASLLEQIFDAGSDFSLTSPVFLLYILMGGASILVGAWVSAIINQSTQRRQLIEQLEATQKELAAAERREGVLEERQRLSREIHDTLAQGFTSIVMHLEAADQAMGSDTSVVRKHLDQARTTARTSLDQARRVVQDLRPDLLEQYSLQQAIEHTAARWQEETGIQVTTRMTGMAVPILSEVEVTLLRATQEALSNIRKHARATEVQITLSYMNDVIMLDVMDDGIGLTQPSASPFAGGYGLQAMHERIAQCGGRLDFESEHDEGTTVVVTIPLSRPE